MSAKATGPISGYTYSPEYVTLVLLGYEKSVRPLRYRWSARNVILSIITVVGIPAIFFVGMVPVDTHIEMLAEDGGD